MIPTRGANSTDDDEFAPESSLLTISMRRSQPVADQMPDNSLSSVWRRAFNAATGQTDEALLKAGLGDRWSECFWVEAGETGEFGIRPVGRLPEEISHLIEGGTGLTALVEQINDIARQTRHSVEMIRTVVQFDDDLAVTSMELTLVPLTAREGIVTRYLGTLGQ